MTRFTQPILSIRASLLWAFILFAQIIQAQEDTTDYTLTFNTAALEDSTSRAALSKALSYYPSLSFKEIKTRRTHIKTTLNIRPTVWSSLFRKKSNRVYILRINTALKDSAFHIDEIPFKARVGLFGHEMAHVVDYSQRNIFGIIGRALQYLSRRGRERYEKEVDHIALIQGLEDFLLEWALFIQRAPDIPKDYKKFKKRFYLEAREIRKISSKNSSE